jgi:hypothetical protein
MTKAEQYAQWIVENADKKGTPEFDTVVEAYQVAKGAAEQPVPAPAAEPYELGTGQSLMQGMRDPVNAMAQMAERAAPSWIRDPINRADSWLHENTGGFLGSPYGSFDERVKAEESDYQQARQEAGESGLDAARLGGNLLATLPAAAAMPYSQTSLLANTGIGAAMGAGFGLLTPSYGDDFMQDKATQAGLGAAGGAIAAPIGAAVGRMISPRTAPEITALMDEGVTPSPGQIMGGGWKATEEKARSMPVFGDLITRANRMSIDDLNRAAYNRALNPIGRTADDLPVGQEGVKAVKQALSDAYEDLLPQLTFQADFPYLQGMNTVRRMVTTLPGTQQRQFNRILQDSLENKMTASGRMSGESLKAAEESLGKEAKGYLADASFDARKLGEALKEVQNLVRQTVQRSNPQQAQRLQDINRGYANYAILRRAGSMQKTEHGFTPAQLASAVKAQDKSVQKGQFATGQALMQDLSGAGRAISQTYPDSGTAGRMLDAGLLGGGAAGAMMGQPAGLALAGGLLGAGTMYTRPMQKILATAMTKRPALAEPLSVFTRRMAPITGATIFAE